MLQLQILIVILGLLLFVGEFHFWTCLQIPFGQTNEEEGSGADNPQLLILAIWGSYTQQLVLEANYFQIELRPLPELDTQSSNHRIWPCFPC